ncbi:hypothetical protein ACYRFS_00200 [Listeria kieliensis]
MYYLIGSIFLLISIWQFFVTWRTFINIKKSGDETTSPFITLALWNSLSFAIIFFTVGIGCFFSDFL